jgi:hypothetical protein
MPARRGGDVLEVFVLAPAGRPGAGRALGDAAREARVAVGRDLGTGSLDWAVPVVFARDPREPLR